MRISPRSFADGGQADRDGGSVRDLRKAGEAGVDERVEVLGGGGTALREDRDPCERTALSV